MTWSKHTTKVIDSKALVTDGTLFYMVEDSAGDFLIKQYNPDTDAEVTIGNNASFPVDNTPGGNLTDEAGLIYFKNNLYCLQRGNGTTEDFSQVWQYDGSGTSWTKRFSNNSDIFTDACYSSTHIAIFMVDTVNGSFYTTDGTVWTQATILSSNSVDIAFSKTTADTTLDMTAVIDIDLTASTDYRYVRFTGSVWAEIATTTPLTIQRSGEDFYWDEVGASGWGYDANVDFSTITFPALATTVYPVISLNYSKSFGSDATNVYHLSLSEWVSMGSISGNAFRVLRLDDDSVYALRDAGGGTFELFKSTESLPDDPSARFYQGAGILTEKFTLPFTGVAPKGFTLDKPLGIVVIGADGNNDDPIVFSESPYVTGTVSDTDFPTTTAINVLGWI